MNETAKNAKISGGRPFFGSAELSGDPVEAVILISLAVVKPGKTKIMNVSRCAYVMRFIEIVRFLGVRIDWIDEKTISVDTSNNLDANLVQFYEKDDQPYLKLLIPGLLYRNGECVVHPKMIEQIKLYKSLEFTVERSYNIITIKLPASASGLTKKHFDIRNYGTLEAVSSLMLKLISSNVDILYDEENTFVRQFDELLSEDGRDKYICGDNSFEFLLLSYLAIFSDGNVDVGISDLSGHLKYLLMLNKAGICYESEKNSLKLWKESPSENPDYYDFSGFSAAEVSYLLLIFSQIFQKSIQVLCDKSHMIEEICTELNMLGFKLHFEPVKDLLRVIIKPFSPEAPIKAVIEDPVLSGVLLATAITAPGTSRISGINVLSAYIPDMEEKLRNLSVSISFS
ncbi:hypothetical protein A2982_01170 [candidate division WWE3 bacterium RIFCSPLOWO2_01_FULL_39_13]|uniref:Enolpyruvate transferase domain-containing protein n=1 Tax=candidate division WWE3 bacterium RIFCSPLOWO2_01_FULL_39_13 TaxID=1802624 RepID=A0A1F4V2E0_UNCKA|nr:MAG: hypothetical protein A2982_01170 [candidate division WWE3 bacterium RIFCSPLOWO2_01_FULL_39_13]